MGQVADVFTEPVLKGLRGWLAIGHTRYSTSGDTVLLNAQPLTVGFNKGLVSVAHNGNLTNARQLRKQLEDRGSIFQTTSDTEVILHLIALSGKKEFEEALAESLLQVEGAYSLVFLYGDRIYAARDPQGFRPLNIGLLAENPSWPGGLNHGKDGAFVFASETCAFDLIGAQLIGEVQPGEIARVDPGGFQVSRFAPETQHSFCIFEHVYFSRPDSVIFGRSVHQSRDNLGRRLAREAPADADLRSLPVEEIRRLYRVLNEEHSAALADEDYERTGRIQREMTRLEEEILRRDREAAPPVAPEFPTPRR